MRKGKTCQRATHAKKQAASDFSRNALAFKVNVVNITDSRQSLRC